MYYGDTTADKLQRRYRKLYSEDGSMEIVNDTQAGSTGFVFYIGGDAYSAPAIWKEEHTSSAVAQNLYYLHRDHLGSILLITDVNGNIVEKRQFDAWGNIVKLTDGNGNDLTGFVITDRGYTGHEHLALAGLIHMNGRLYDPMLHRFLSPDNFVQDPSNTQNFNRYAYVMNNPLVRVDKDGEFIWFIPALIGGVSNWLAHGAQFSWKGLGYFGVGAAAGALGAGAASGATSLLGGGAAIGSSFFTGATVGAAGGFAGGFSSGLGNSLLGGSGFGSALGTAFKNGGIGAITGGVVGGVAGGIDAASDGRDFWSGAGESQHDILLSGGSGSQYGSNSEMRSDYDTNIGSRDGLSLEQVESKLNTNVSLAGDGYSIDGDGLIVRGNHTVGGTTYAKYSGGKLISTKIVIAPGLKGFDLNIRNMVFKHEFMHVWHHNINPALFDRFSERATSTYSYAYAKAYGANYLLSGYKAAIGSYPSQYSWRNFDKIIPLWLK